MTSRISCLTLTALAALSPLTQAQIIPPAAPATLSARATASPRYVMNLTELQRQQLEKSHAQYDPQEKLLAQHRGGGYDYNTYLRNQTVHPTRESLAYATKLLDTGNPQWEARAFDILRRVLEFQITDPKHDGYGIWGKYSEEPLDKAPYIDRNWADFLGKNYLHVAMYHAHRLPPDLQGEVKTGLLRAAEAIKRRNVGPGYTNIAVMGTYVTLLTANLYNDAELRAYAIERLKKLHAFTRDLGGFAEYNSPTYTGVALGDLQRFVRDVRDPEAKPLVEDLHRVAWEEIATHFHAPTRQWAGPYSRNYGSLVSDSHAALIERHTSPAVEFGRVGDAEKAQTEPKCPPELERYFGPLREARTERRVFQKETLPHVVGTTYLHPQFALGTVNYQDMWNQRRNLLAHWGTSQQPSYLHLRFLHDGFDFQTMRFAAQQQEGRALVALHLATDGGDKHPSLDKIKDATIQGKEWRVRWEFGGDAKDVAIQAPADLSQPAHIVADGLHFRIAAPHARWGESTGRWEAGRDDKTAWLDIVFYDDPERTWKLDELGHVAAGMALQITPTDEPMVPVEVTERDERLALRWNGLALSVATQPEGAAALREKVRLGEAN